MTLREDLRVPFRMIQRHLQSTSGLHLSRGALVGACHQVAISGQDALEAIVATMRAGPAVNLDETGWRENGTNGSVWTASTPTACLFVRGTREQELVDFLLGPDFGGVLVSDFYAGYHHDPGMKQKCWAHLLREAHDLTRAYPDDRALARWKRRLHALFR